MACAQTCTRLKDVHITSLGSKVSLAALVKARPQVLTGCQMLRDYCSAAAQRSLPTTPALWPNAKLRVVPLLLDGLNCLGALQVVSHQQLQGYRAVLADEGCTASVTWAKAGKSSCRHAQGGLA